MSKSPVRVLTMLFAASAAIALTSPILADPCEQVKLVEPTSGDGDFFGRSVAVDGTIAIVGSPRRNEVGSRSGAAYVYRNDGGVWLQDQILVPGDAEAMDLFGFVVAIDGDNAVIGAIGGDTTGSAYVYRRDDNSSPGDPSDDTWVEQVKLLGSDSAPADLYSVDLTIQGDLIAVGADGHDTPVFNGGAVYLYRRDDATTPVDPSDDTWPQLQKISPDDPGSNDLFGHAVALAGPWLLVGAYLDNEVAVGAGSAYFFLQDEAGTPGDLSDDSWSQTQKVFPTDLGSVDQFAVRCAISADWAMMGAHQHDLVNTNGGAVYVYRRDDAGTPGDLTDDTWVEHQKLSPTVTLDGARFGRSVTIEGDTAVIGANGNSVAGPMAGAVYIFQRNDGGTPTDLSDDTWQEVLEVIGDDVAANDEFGLAVSFSAGTLIAGAPEDDDVAVDAGAAYLFDIFGGIDCDTNGINDACETDCNGNEILDSCDIAALTSNDCNSSGVPDECELGALDCNTNLLIDSCELAAGTTADCNTNSVPDDCDLLDPAMFDCNTNSFIDTCEIADSLADDCNGNDLPDDCETLATGIDDDGDLDLQDLAGFTRCYTGAGPVAVPPACCIYDFDSDSDVDLDDWGLLEAGMTGP